MCEVIDSSKNLQLNMTWTDNMGNKTQPQIKKGKFKKDSVKITFYPDFPRFNMERFDDDLLALCTKRVYDIAGCSAKNIKV